MPIKTIIESFAAAHNDERFINGGGSSCITADGITKLKPAGGSKSSDMNPVSI